MRPRSIAPVAVAALALSAWLHARGVSALVGAGLQVPHVPPAAAPPAASPEPPPRSADVILARNAFDSATGSLLPAARAGAVHSKDCCDFSIRDSSDDASDVPRIGAMTSAKANRFDEETI